MQFSQHPGEKFDISPFVDSCCKTPVEEIQTAIDGAISKEQAVKLRQCLDHIDELQKHISEVEQEILCLSDKYEAALNLIRTVPEFDKNPMTAIQGFQRLAVIYLSPPTAKHFVSWAGCCPHNDKSDRKIKSTKISRAAFYFKLVLVQVANALIKSKKHPEF
ncbi:MAG: transposase, partial [Bacilli bacterium]